jgi:hypothetical protein
MRSCSELIKKALKNSLMTAQKVVRPGVETTFIRSESRSEGDYYTKDFSCLRCACAVCCLGCLHVSYVFIPASYALFTHISIQIKGSSWEIQPPSLAALLLSNSHRDPVLLQQFPGQIMGANICEQLDVK